MRILAVVLNNMKWRLNPGCHRTYSVTAVRMIMAAKFDENIMTTRNTYKAIKALSGCVKRVSKY
jgi:hypothetical protein